MNLRVFFSLILFFCLLIPSSISAETDFWSDQDKDTLVHELLSEMSDSQKLGQLMLFGYMGGTPPKEILDWIGKNGIGGVKIFGWNVSTLPNLASSITKMQKTSQRTEFKIPLFIVTDQEGGWVRHIHTGTSETSGNMSLGASRIPEDSFKTGYYIGMEMHNLGINVNFAPTVDVYSNPKADVIGPRAFSNDAKLTALLACAYFKGMDSAGIICTAKHYPGHGAADKDSHGALPIIPADMDTLWKRDLLPYRYLVKEGLPAIMSGHLAFPNVTGDDTPASLSKYFLTDLLRNKIGFNGLVITDDIMMNGVQLLPINTSEISKAAIMAGNDIVLVSRTAELQKKVWKYLSSELKTDPAFKARVEESAERVLRTKIRYLKTEAAAPLFPDPAAVSSLIPDPEGTDFFFDQAVRSTTVIRSTNGTEGLHAKGKILLAGQLERFFDEGKKIYPDADSFDFDYTPFYTASSSVEAQLKRKAAGYDTVIFCLANPNSAHVLESLKGLSCNIIVLSVLTPIYLKDMDWIKNAVAVYGTSKDAFMAGFAALSGEIAPSGILPLKDF